jgi:histidine triad (HIT) family protein
MTPGDCLFCKIVAGEIPSFNVYEDGNTFAFLDINPVNAGHTLVVPKRHSQNIFDIPPEDWMAVSETARSVAIALESALNADGVNLMMNNRENAGQVIDHPHVHVIPRFQGDGLRHWPQHKYKKGEAEETLAKIRATLQ